MYTELTDEILAHAKTVLTIKDYREKLQYYNDYIGSLSFDLNDDRMLECYGHGFRRADFDGASIILYAAKRNTYNNFDGEFVPFTDEQHDIFYELRQKEIDRLKAKINRQKTYEGKLRALITSRTGKPSFKSLCVVSNEFLKAIDQESPVDWSNHYSININPITHEDEMVLNYLIRDSYLKSIDGDKEALFSYQGFKFIDAKLDFLKRYNNAFDKDLAISQEIALAKSQPIQNLLIGKTIDSYELRPEKMHAVVEVEQWFEFYKWLIQLKKNEIPKPIPYQIEELKDRFLPYAIKDYVEVELRLMDIGLIDTDYKFIPKKDNKKLMVALIYILQDRGYLKIGGKSFLSNRKFFERRYKTDLSDTAKPSNFPAGEQKKYSTIFHFIVMQSKRG